MLTAIFVLGVRLPHGPLVIAITFLCGLVPIVGNLVSNTINRFPCLDGFLEACNRGTRVSCFDSQSWNILEQQNHRQPDSESCLADVDRADYRRKTDGYSGIDSRTGRVELSARGNADSRSIAGTGKS